MEPEVTTEANIEAVAAPAPAAVTEAPAAAPPPVPEWNGEISGLDAVLGLLPDPSLKDAVRAGVSKVRANMDRAFHNKSQELAAERRRLAQEKSAALEHIKQAKEAAKQWAQAIEDEEVQEVLSALQNDAAYQIELLQAERDEARAQAEAAKAHIDNVAAAVRDALSREYDERVNALRAERESERAELEAARAARAQAEAAQTKLREEEERRQMDEYARRITEAVEAHGGLLPENQRNFAVLEHFFQPASKQVMLAKGLTNEDIDKMTDEAYNALLDETFKVAGRIAAALHPKPASPPVPANPNAVRPPAVAEALATQSKSGNGALTGLPAQKKVVASIY